MAHKKILYIIISVTLTILMLTSAMCSQAATVTGVQPLGYFLPDWNYTVIVTRLSDGLTYSNPAPTGSIRSTSQNRFSLATQYKLYDANSTTYYTYNDSPNCYGYLNNSTSNKVIANKIELYGTTNGASYKVEYIMHDLFTWANSAVMPTITSTTNATVDSASYFISIEYLTLSGNWVTQTYSGSGVAPELTNDDGTGLLDYGRYDESVPIHINTYYITLNASKTSTSTSNVGINNNYRYIANSNYTDLDFDLTYNGTCREEFYSAYATTQAGYDIGYGEGELRGYNNGYNDGRIIGYNEGNRTGYYEGFDEGYLRGKSEAVQDAYEDLSFTRWLTVSVGAFFEFELMPNVSVGLILGLIVGAALFAFAMRLMR